MFSQQFKYERMSSAAKPLELVCAVYGEQNAFHVKIAPDAEVSALQEALAARLSTEAHKIDSRLVTLYLAKKDNVWLKDDDEETEFLHGNVVDKQYKKMCSTWMLSDPKYFGVDFEPQPKDIHVLVKLGSEGLFRQDRGTVVVDGVEIPITQDMDVNSTEMAAFWNALRACSTEIEPDAVIALPEGTYFLGEQKFGSRVYIRHCYPSLLKNCWDLLHYVPSGAQVPSDAIILGNPGIGKTFFGCVILFHLARLGATVVYETTGTDKCCLFSSDTVITGLRRNFRHILGKQTTYYLVDAMKPEVNAAKTILLTSPRRSIWYEFNKANGTSRYMPVWSLAELMKCRDLVYPNIPVVTVADCFRRWGGIARYVLAYTNFRDQQDMLEKAIAAVDLDVLVEACGKFEANDAQISHRLLHYVVNQNFGSERLVFASQYVQDEVYKNLLAKNRQQLLQFLTASEGVGAVAVLRGLLFEGYVHSILPQGGVFRIRRLIDNGEPYVDDNVVGQEEWRLEGGNENEDDVGDLNIDMEDAQDIEDMLKGDEVSLVRMETVEFMDYQDIVHAAENVYLRPVSKNFQSVDSIIKPAALFQVTGAHRHPCKQKGLHDVLSELGNPTHPRLYFVVPPDRFTSFRYQPYLNAKGKAMREPMYVNVRTIQQFALQVEITL